MKLSQVFAIAQTRVPELMDDPDLAPAHHKLALEGLARLNAFGGGASVLWGAIARFAKENKKTELRVLEIASGGGDILFDLARRARSSGLKLHLTGSDISPGALDLAKRKCEREFPAAQFVVLDALREPLPDGFDIVTTSLFTHHLEAGSVSQLMRKMYDAAGDLILINDLERSAINLVLVILASQIVSASEIVHYDAPVSVRASYTLSEFLELAEQAELEDSQIQIERIFPCRFLFSASKHVKTVEN